MAIPETLIPGCELKDPRSDLRTAVRVEQYRLGKEALYIPAGLRWKYIPLRAIREVSASHRTVSAGHCVTVQVRTPSLEIITEAGTFDLDLEKQASLERFLAVLSPEKACT